MKNKYAVMMAVLCLITFLTGSLLAVAQAEAPEGGTSIVLEGTTATVTGPGATVDGATVTIADAGAYTVSGSLTGSIVIDAPDDADVQLILSGVHIQADQNAAIYCKNADNLIITLAYGTENSLADAANFAYADATAEEPDAALFSKIDLTLEAEEGDGTAAVGSLTVTAGYNNGIGTKDDLDITGGTYVVDAANHGIRGRDSVTVTGGDLTITAGADGIQANNDSGADKGWIDLSGGTYVITAGNDAIQAESTLTVSSGDYTLVSGGGHTAAPADSTGSYKGLKATGNIAISGGTFVIDSLDDGVHAGSDITITGGDLTISTADDAVHADGHLEVEAGSIEVLASYEGLEGNTITLAGGDITINATDDGINAAGGTDGSMMGGRGGGRVQAVSIDSAEHWLRITGGTITVVAGSDAIDVNGVAEMTGGTVDLTAATLGEGETVDTDGGFSQTGGDLTETGGRGFGGGMMNQNPNRQRPGGGATETTGDDGVQIAVAEEGLPGGSALSSDSVAQVMEEVETVDATDAAATVARGVIGYPPGGLARSKSSTADTATNATSVEAAADSARSHRRVLEAADRDADTKGSNAISDKGSSRRPSTIETERGGTGAHSKGSHGRAASGVADDAADSTTKASSHRVRPTSEGRHGKDTGKSPSTPNTGCTCCDACAGSSAQPAGPSRRTPSTRRRPNNY